VKAVVSWQDETFGKAIYFSRAAIPTGTNALWHHIGVYGWQRDALARFVSQPPSILELAEKLEQLRALELGMTITVGKIATAPRGIDTAEDLEAARLGAAATKRDD
jgi:3-deoxy-manno-octulosonate cytidylyltransferase (CMP-KDO synthetase)